MILYYNKLKSKILQVFFRENAVFYKEMEKKMNFNAIICEYNPFHNGHKYHIHSVKAQNPAPTAVIMSGDFTQRGDISVTDKFKRAKTAVENGADLVVELPTVYALGSAETFARGGVKIAEGMGCIRNLCFGAETDDKAMLIKTAEAFETEGFKASLKEYMNQGCYYPQAVEMAMGDISQQLAEVVKSPNNILAVEYIKQSVSLDFIVTKRTGADHDSDSGDANIRSASQIRKMLLGGEDVSPFTPSVIEYPASADKLEKVILYKLRSMTAEDFAQLPDIAEGLENRFVQAVKASVSVDEILEKVKTKRYTMARLRRIVFCALLGINAEMSKYDPPYIRVLAFNKYGAEIMREIKNHGKIPMITNVADGYNNLDEKAKRIFDVDIRAGDIHSLATDKIKPCARDFTEKIFVMK